MIPPKSVAPDNERWAYIPFASHLEISESGKIRDRRTHHPWPLVAYKNKVTGRASVSASIYTNKGRKLRIDVPELVDKLHKTKTSSKRSAFFNRHVSHESF